MAPSELERRETVGSGISVSMYRIWATFGGGYDIVARNGTELERIHTHILAIGADNGGCLVCGPLRLNICQFFDRC